ncbi:CAP domain-containing protein [Syncephalis plumigaleata]|nr:CAP domain-containing protein [Syncephalis plumigaleata]
MKFTAVIAIATALIAIHTGQATASPTSTTATSTGFNPTKMLCLVNELRTKNKLAPLGMNEELVKIAQKHSEYQAENNKLTHTIPGEPALNQRILTTGNWTFSAENIASGFDTEEKVMKNWAGAEGHLKNMLSNATHFGAGKAQSKDGKVYWTQTFGKNTLLPMILPKC